MSHYGKVTQRLQRCLLTTFEQQVKGSAGSVILNVCDKYATPLYSDPKALVWSSRAYLAQCRGCSWRPERWGLMHCQRCITMYCYAFLLARTSSRSFPSHSLVRLQRYLAHLRIAGKLAHVDDSFATEPILRCKESKKLPLQLPVLRSAWPR